MKHVIVKTRFIHVCAVIAIAWATILVPVSNASAQVMCVDLFKSPLFAPKFDRLYDFYRSEIQGLKDSQVERLNKTMIEHLREYVPAANENRAQSISARDAQNLVNAARSHPVAGDDDRYQRPDSDTGFCFGRATYLHLTALKMGLQKDSILKIWAIGPMKSSLNAEITWGYHVSTMVYTKEGGWLVIDPNYYMPQSFESWMQQYQQQSVDHRLRFYVTGAEKFGLYAGKYTPYLLGLVQPKDQDFFKGYFVDLLKAVRTETLESLNLRRVSAEQGKIVLDESPASILAAIKDFLGIF